jgi:hypothetical protein
VNFTMLTLHGSDPDASVLFETSIHQRLFNIIPPHSPHQFLIS